MARPIYAINLTASGVEIDDLSGLYIEPYDTVDLRLFFSLDELDHSDDLQTAIINGWIVLNDGEKDLSLEDSEQLSAVPTFYDVPTHFISLGDTPTTYSGAEGGDYFVRVTESGTGVEFININDYISDNITAGQVEAFYAESMETSATTSLNFRDKVTLSFTPTSSGVFEIIHSCLQSSDDSGIPYKTRLIIDDTTPIQQTFEELYNFSHVVDAWRLRSGTFVEGLDATPHTIKLQYCTGKKNRVVYIKEAFISVKKLVIIE